MCYTGYVARQCDKLCFMNTKSQTTKSVQSLVTCGFVAARSSFSFVPTYWCISLQT